MIFFKVNDKFKDTTMLFVDTRIKPTKELKAKNGKFSLLVDKNNQVKLINYFKELDLNANYGLLDNDLVSTIGAEIINEFPQVKINHQNYYELGKIVKRAQHPKSEKLAILTVDFKDKVLQIITNTTYTLENMFFVFALPGTMTAKGDEILEGSLLNEKSQGMLASPTTLGFTKESSQEYFDRFINFINQEEISEQFWGKGVKELIERFLGE
ncbi:TyrS-associated PheT N-terminal domain-related protein TapR [Mycoplasmopsis iners]|uniref:TyrS-associated PheT N-terminal domain-related protein TapR n=1 Tax=Mycoplasmopsis iners TaxID=76630 RepID=UPI000691EA7C|nr:hypothetical protein [Mycoplasmopsis iners]